MISSVRNMAWFRFVWIIVCFQILNLSVDAPDGHSDAIAEDLSINDMESIVEIVLEEVLDIKNAIAEQDEQDDDAGNSLCKTNIDFFLQPLNVISIKVNYDFETSDKILFTDKFYYQYNPEKQTPPPKFSA
jgi:hypothetical protein